MSCECSNVSTNPRIDRKTLIQAFVLNATMFVVGVWAGYLAQSTGVMADALDMGTDAVSYALALLAITRSSNFKRSAARWTGLVLIVLGAGIVIEVVRRAIFGSEPVGLAMMAYSIVSFCVNLYVLTLLSKYRRGEVHLRATYICTRADVLANIGVFISGGIVAVTGFRFVDLVAGFAIGLYVLKEALEIMREASNAGD